MSNRCVCISSFLVFPIYVSFRFLPNSISCFIMKAENVYTPELQAFFDTVSRFNVKKVRIQRPLRPFTLEYVPAVSPIERYISPPRPDGNKRSLKCLNEPTQPHLHPDTLNYSLHTMLKIPRHPLSIGAHEPSKIHAFINHLPKTSLPSVLLDSTVEQTRAQIELLKQRDPNLASAFSTVTAGMTFGQTLDLLLAILRGPCSSKIETMHSLIHTVLENNRQCRV